ncbi:MAG TPA: GntR family transcriptional regulator [Burkholderiaceae bacterium]|nr:GntR family transcriptional regulator [Burkholderiaceae bacterium]
MASTLKLDRYRQAAPQLYELLRDKIVALEYLPGAVLSRVDISMQFNVSQTPVREALLRLAEERLVDVFPQAATRVSLIDTHIAEETHFLRRAIELEIVRELALHGAPSLIATLRDLVATQVRLRDRQDYDGFVVADREFHRSLYAAVGKEELWRLVCSRSGHIDRLRRLHLPAGDKMARIVDDHGRILEAITGRDPGAAQDRLRQHLSGTLENMDRIRDEHPQYFVQG